MERSMSSYTQKGQLVDRWNLLKNCIFVNFFYFLYIAMNFPALCLPSWRPRFWGQRTPWNFWPASMCKIAHIMYTQYMAHKIIASYPRLGYYSPHASRFCGLLQFPSIRMSTLNRIMVFLCHGFPRVSSHSSVKKSIWLYIFFFSDP